MPMGLPSSSAPVPKLGLPGLLKPLNPRGACVLEGGMDDASTLGAWNLQPAYGQLQVPNSQLQAPDSKLLPNSQPAGSVCCTSQ